MNIRSVKCLAIRLGAQVNFYEQNSQRHVAELPIAHRKRRRVVKFVLEGTLKSKTCNIMDVKAKNQEKLPLKEIQASDHFLLANKKQ